MPDGYSERGFARYKDGIVTRYGDVVQVYESSSATERSVWLAIEPHDDDQDRASAHMNEVQAREVLDGLAEFLGLDLPAATPEGGEERG